MDFLVLEDSQEEFHRLILYLPTNFIDVYLTERWQLESACGNTNVKIGPFMQRVCGYRSTEETLDPVLLL